ncbi:hypothetical protein JW926_18335 [Candidatus Sumerlaeota bacterium]|nr:hypothetical protein [Candidatus Sumerlaeota bacterium]
MAQEKNKKGGITAFGIMTFLLALAAFIMSSMALFITYDNGRLLRDAQVVLNDLNSSIRERRSAMFYSGEQSKTEQEQGDKEKILENLGMKMEAIRSRFIDTLDYLETGQKIEEWRKELEETQKKWGFLSGEKFKELREEINNTANAMKNKSPDATLKLDTLSDRINVLLKE